MKWSPALDELRRRHGARVQALVQAIVRDAHIAEDVSQEVFAKVFFKSHLYRRGTSFRAWLFEVARNQALTTLRARRQVPTPMGSLKPGREEAPTDLLESLRDPHVDQLLEEQELMTEFDRAVDELPDRYREVFRLCVQHGMQYRDVADKLGIPSGTVAIRLMRARRRLFDALSSHLGRIRRPPACLQ